MAFFASPTHSRAVIAVVLWGIAGIAGAATLQAPGLSAPGSIGYDADGMPLIQAATENDAAFLLGYAAARDRFFEMDATRRTASGTLAELVGPSKLAEDVQTRTLGLRRAAWLTWQASSDDMRGWLKAYADGVNFWLQTHPLPPEYAALELTHAESWSPVDTIVIGKALAFQLSFDLDIDPTLQLAAYQQAGAAGGFDGSVLFFGDTHRFAPPDDRVTIPDFSPEATAAGVAPKLAALAAGGAPSMPTLDPSLVAMAQAYRDRIAGNALIAPHLNVRMDRAGSNEWAVSGSLTASGKPIVSNDPHLSLALPPIFSEVHIIVPGVLNATGVSVPGTPGVIQGCNERICWGTTTNPLDVTDVFQEKFRLNTYGLPTAIVHDGVDEPVEWVFQSFYVNAVGDGTTDNLARANSIGYTNGAVTVVVPRRNHGPVVQIDQANSQGLSIAYTGWGATFELESFRRINKAKNRAEFEEALSYFDVGSQNFAYADIDGNIAYYTSAEAPVRTDLQTQNAPGGGRPPWIVRDGTGVLKHDWLPLQHPQPNQAVPFEVLPASEMPHVVNPPEGFFANANNDPVGTTLDNNPLNQVRPGGGLYYLNWNYSAFRQGRIQRELERLAASGKKITSADMQALQANTQAMDAELVLPHLLAAYVNASKDGAWPPLAALAADARVGEAIDRLSSWDYSAPTGIPQGYDPGDNPNALPQPGQAEIDASVAASIFAIWRGQAIRASVDAGLAKVGLGSVLPGGDDAYTSFKFLLDYFPVLKGKGASGVTFFAADGAPSPEAARDYVLLKALKDGLDRFASAAFAPAFGGSTNLGDYRWGRLHRIVFSHPLGPTFSLPGNNAYGFNHLSPELPGLARAGAWDAVNVANHSVRAQNLNDFMFGSGPARRFVGEMSNPIAASQVIPGGNSAVLGSPFYASQIGRWLTNTYHPLIVAAAPAIAATGNVTQFAPK